MTLATYSFRRGEPIVFGDRVESGAVLAGHTMRARMKPVRATMGESMPGDTVATVTPPFATVFTAAAGAEPAFWLHGLTSAQSLTIPAGGYLADSALLLNGVVVAITDPVRIVIREAASGA